MCEELFLYAKKTFFFVHVPSPPGLGGGNGEDGASQKFQTVARRQMALHRLVHTTVWTINFRATLRRTRYPKLLPSRALEGSFSASQLTSGTKPNRSRLQR